LCRRTEDLQFTKNGSERAAFFVLEMVLHDREVDLGDGAGEFTRVVFRRDQFVMYVISGDGVDIVQAIGYDALEGVCTSIGDRPVGQGGDLFFDFCKQFK
jgi:hypothetical protein